MGIVGEYLPKGIARMRWKIHSIFAFTTAAFLLTTPLLKANTTEIWNGGIGYWADIANWSPALVPRNVDKTTFDVLVDGNTTQVSTVMVDGSFGSGTVDSITVSAGDQLSLLPSCTFLAAATVDNSGTVSIASSTFLPTVLNGSGIVSLENGTLGSSSAPFSNSANTILGRGSLLGLVYNSGTILAGASSQLQLLWNGSFTNTGLMTAVDGGTFTASGGTIFNSGTVNFCGSGSVSQLANTRYFTVSGAGTTFNINGGSNVFAVNNADGTLAVSSGATISIGAGTITGGFLKTDATSTFLIAGVKTNFPQLLWRYNH